MTITILLQDINSIYEAARERQADTTEMLEYIKFGGLIAAAYFLIKEYGWWTWRREMIDLKEAYFKESTRQLLKDTMTEKIEKVDLSKERPITEEDIKNMTK